ncbi:MAG: methyl-accepting chemotaxis protein [Afipia sp.]
MIWFKNLPIKAKVLFAPVLLLACLVGLSFQSYLALTYTTGHLRQLTNSQLPKSAAVQSLAAAVSESQLLLFRYVSWLNSGIVGDKLETLERQIKVGNAELTGQSETIAQRPDLDAEETAIVREFDTNLKKYVSLSNNTIEMGTLQQSMAVMMLAEAYDMFIKTRSDVDKMLEITSSRSRTLTSSIEVKTVRSTISMLVAIAAAITICVLVTIMASNSVSGPVNRLALAMRSIASGNLDAQVPDLERRDEIGDMSAALNVFKQAAIEAVGRKEQADRVKAEAERRAVMSGLADGFEDSVSSVVQSVLSAADQMLSVANLMSTTAERVSQRLNVVALAAERATLNVETVAAASEQMSRSLAEVSERISSAADMTGRVTGEAMEASTKANKLATSADAITGVLKMIGAIAGQTNLLALNATIEAARAGDAGKGFAVVALEVKHLSSQTTQATERIAVSIEEMQTDTSSVVSAIEMIGGLVDSLDKVASAVALTAKEQQLATLEIAKGTIEAATGTRKVTGDLAGVSSEMNETGIAAQQVLNVATELSTQAKSLKFHVSQFLDDVRSG